MPLSRLVALSMAGILTVAPSLQSSRVRGGGGAERLPQAILLAARRGGDVSASACARVSSRAAPSAVKLDQYLKWLGLAATGGEAKQRIQRGDVRVNGLLETRRGRQLGLGDAVQIDGREILVTPPPARP